MKKPAITSFKTLMFCISCAIALLGVACSEPRAHTESASDTAVESKTPEPQGSGAATGMIRTPADIEKDRNIVPNGGTPVEVPNRSTLPEDEYRQMKKGGADRIRPAPDSSDPQE